MNTTTMFLLKISGVLEQLALTNVTVVAHGMSACIALQYLATYGDDRVSKLVMTGAVMGCSMRDSHAKDTKKHVDMITLCQQDRAQLIANVLKNLFATRDAVSHAMCEWIRHLAMQASPHAMLQALLAIRDSTNDLAAIRIPVLICHGILDKIAPFENARGLQKGIVNSELIEFAQSGNVPFIEEKEKFNRVVIDFINDL